MMTKSADSESSFSTRARCLQAQAGAIVTLLLLIARNRSRRAERGCLSRSASNDPVRTRFIWRAPTTIERAAAETAALPAVADRLAEGNEGRSMVEEEACAVDEGPS